MSSLPGTKLLVDLTDAELTTLCQDEARIEHAPRTVTCPDGSTTTIDDQATCKMAFDGHLAASCAVTVAQAETCFQAIGRDPCNTMLQACMALAGCYAP